MENQEQKFKLFKVLRAHLLPLTNCAFNKSGDKFITGSYDRTCKVWDTESGTELLSLEEHKNVVYTMAFNNPFGNLIVTGSFDRTAKIWDANNGEMKHTLMVIRWKQFVLALTLMVYQLLQVQWITPQKFGTWNKAKNYLVQMGIKQKQ